MNAYEKLMAVDGAARSFRYQGAWWVGNKFCVARCRSLFQVPRDVVGEVPSESQFKRLLKSAPSYGIDLHAGALHHDGCPTRELVGMFPDESGQLTYRAMFVKEAYLHVFGDDVRRLWLCADPRKKQIVVRADGMDLGMIAAMSLSNDFFVDISYDPDLESRWAWEQALYLRDADNVIIPRKEYESLYAMLDTVSSVACYDSEWTEADRLACTEIFEREQLRAIKNGMITQYHSRGPSGNG